MLPNANDTCRMRYGAPIWPRRSMMATRGPPTTLLEVPTGRPIACATGPEKAFAPWSNTELLDTRQALLVKPGMPPNETKPWNCFIVGSKTDPESLTLGIRPSEPGGSLVTVEMGTPRGD